MQAALADILSAIPLFWGHFKSNIPYFWLRMEEAELEMGNWGWIKDIQGKGRGNSDLRCQNWGWRTVDWGWPINNWGFNYATPTFNAHFSGQPLSRIMLFWGHYKSRNFLLEVILQLFPGLVMGWWIGSAMGWWVELVGLGGGVGLVFGVEAHCLVVFNSKWLELIDFSYLCLLKKRFHK